MHRKEITLDLLGYVFRVLKKWKRMIAFAILGAFLCGGLKYYQNDKAYKAYEVQLGEQSENEKISLAEKKEELLSGFSETERQTAENIVELENSLIVQNSYRETAAVSQLDPYGVDRVMFSYTVEANGKAAAICRSYSNSIFEEDAKELIVNASNGKVRSTDIVDLISVSVDDSKDVMEEKTDNRGFFSVCVRGVDKESAENMAAAVEGIIANSQNVVTEELGEHSLSKLGYHYVKGRDEAIISIVNAVDSDISTKYSQIWQLKAQLPEEQMTKLNSYLDMMHLQDENGMVEANDSLPEEVLPAKIDVKWIVIGFLLGIFIACVWEGVLWILGGQVNTKKEFWENVSLRSFGVIADIDEEVKKGTIDRLIHRIQTIGKTKLSEEEEYQMMLADIKLLAAEENIQKIYLTGTEGVTAPDCMERIKEDLQNCGIEIVFGDSVLSSSKSMCDMAECDATIIVEYIGKSKYKNVFSELSVCEKHNVNVLGSILID